MLQYRGELLTLKDEGDVLPELEAVRQQGEEAQATVLFCGDTAMAAMSMPEPCPVGTKGPWIFVQLLPPSVDFKIPTP